MIDIFVRFYFIMLSTTLTTVSIWNSLQKSNIHYVQIFADGKYYTLKGGDMEKFILSLLCKYLAWVV